MTGTRPPTPVPTDAKPWWPMFAVGALAVLGWLKPTADRRTAGTPAVRAAAGPATAPAPAAAHGHAVHGPTDISLSGWKDIARRVYRSINDDRLLAVAAGVTFYALLAIFPAIAALVSLYGLISDPAMIAKQLDVLNGILPEGAIGIIGEEVKRLAATPGGSLSFALAISLGISLWSANAGMKAVFDALNVACDEKEERSFVKLNLISLAFTLGAIIFLILAMACVVVMPVVLNFVGLGGLAKVALAAARWPILLGIVVGGLSVLYRYGPSRPVARWRWIFWGAGFAAVLWVIASMLFSLYVSKFGSYNATYGSLGSAVGFMTWMWISSIIVLIGAEISGDMEAETSDGAAGASKPEGRRDGPAATKTAPA